MGLVISDESQYGKELWKFSNYDDTEHPSDPKVRGIMKRGFQPYPEMLYKVRTRNPLTFDESIAYSDDEKRSMEAQGFLGGGPLAAFHAYEEADREIALVAAHRNYEDRNMSEMAKREIERVESSSARHTPEIPRTPVRKRGRPAKAIPVGQ